MICNQCGNNMKQLFSSFYCDCGSNPVPFTPEADDSSDLVFQVQIPAYSFGSIKYVPSNTPAPNPAVATANSQQWIFLKQIINDYTMHLDTKILRTDLDNHGFEIFEVGDIGFMGSISPVCYTLILPTKKVARIYDIMAAQSETQMHTDLYWNTIVGSVNQGIWLVDDANSPHFQPYSALSDATNPAGWLLYEYK